MDQIVGTRIRYKWSAQAASCLASSSPNGYFSHPDFNRTACSTGEPCDAGFRTKRMSERLADLLNVAQALATPNPDPTYQGNLDIARTSAYLVIDALGAAPTTTAAFYGSMVIEYSHFIEQLGIVLDLALPPLARTAVLDQLCSAENVAQLEDLQNQCSGQDPCPLVDLFNTIDFCEGYQNGGTLTDSITKATTVKAGMMSERERLITEHDQIIERWSQIQSLHPSSIPLPPACNIRYPFGTAQLPLSDFEAGHYGADLSLLYGGWEWSGLGVASSTAKSLLYINDVASLIRDCIGDVRYGRLDFSRHQVNDDNGSRRAETDQEYYVRALGNVTKVRQDLDKIELSFTGLLHDNAPLVNDGDVNSLKTIVNTTQLRVRELVANRTTGLGWVVVLMQEFLDASERYAVAQEATRNLITVFRTQFPGGRDVVIDMLIANTDLVLDQYGQFFSLSRRGSIEALLMDAETQNDDNLDVALSALGEIADDLQGEFDDVWRANEPLGMFASELKFIFGDCAFTPEVHPLLTPAYFGDLPVAVRIVQEGNDAQFCSQ